MSVACKQKSRRECDDGGSLTKNTFTLEEHTFAGWNTDKNGNAVPLEIQPLASEKNVDYIADKNGGAETGVSSTRYDAIVEPWNYADKPDEQAM